MKQLFRILLAVTIVAVMSVSCKKNQPEKPKQEGTFLLEATVEGEAQYDGSMDIAYTVKSIKKIGEKEVFVPWTMEFSTDGGNTWKAEKPEFLALTTKEENGDLTAKAYTATFAPQIKSIEGTSSDILKAREVLNDVDLSMVDVLGKPLTNGQSTANCYVIHNPGTYKFPTIYGNAKKDGANNTIAYKSTKSGENILTTFLGANGPITKPQIEGIKDACLIWQDSPNLVSNISYDSSTQYVKLEVGKNTIHNGNAIIAVRDASNIILWSWHIWVTEEDLTPVEVTNNKGSKYDLMPVNIGWCGDGSTTINYAPCEVKVRVKQVMGNETKEIYFKIKGHTAVVNNHGNNPYYQWGRKDPMLPGNGITEGDGKDKTCYTTDDRYQFAYQGHGEPLNTSDIKEYIRNPHKFNTKREMDGQYYNLWSTDNDKTDANDEVVMKSVYDPSPVGYSLPASNVFTGFTTTGGNTSNPAEFNVNGGFDKGWHFYCKPNKQGSIVFFPVSGSRHYGTGSLDNVSTFGYYWVAGPSDRRSGCYLNFNSSHVRPLDYTGRSCGLSVRCAKEK